MKNRSDHRADSQYYVTTVIRQLTNQPGKQLSIPQFGCAHSPYIFFNPIQS